MKVISIMLKIRWRISLLDEIVWDKTWDLLKEYLFSPVLSIYGLPKSSGIAEQKIDNLLYYILAYVKLMAYCHHIMTALTLLLSPPLPIRTPRSLQVSQILLTVSKFNGSRHAYNMSHVHHFETWCSSL